MEPQLDSEWDWEAALKNHPSKRRHAGSLPPIFSASTENAANLYHSRAAVRGSPSPERKLQPFHIPRELEQRLESLGAVSLCLIQHLVDKQCHEESAILKLKASKTP